MSERETMAEEIVRTVVYAYRSHPNNFDPAVAAKNVEAILDRRLASLLEAVEEEDD